MPRKHDPRIDENGMVLIELERGDTRRGALRKQYQAEMTEAEIERLIAIAGRYTYNLKTGTNGPCRKAARANLELALEYLNRTGQLIPMNRAAESWFLNALLVLPHEAIGPRTQGSRSKLYIEDALPKQAAGLALTAALTNIKAKRGAAPDIAVSELVDGLCGLYRDVFDLPVTHSVKRHSKSGLHNADNDRSPKSPAGRFVLNAAQIIDPNIRSQTVSTCLGSYVKRLRAKIAAA